MRSEYEANRALARAVAAAPATRRAIQRADSLRTGIAYALTLANVAIWLHVATVVTR